MLVNLSKIRCKQMHWMSEKTWKWHKHRCKSPFGVQSNTHAPRQNIILSVGAAYLWRTIMRTKTTQQLKTLLSHYHTLEDDDRMYEKSLCTNLKKFHTHW